MYFCDITKLTKMETPLQLLEKELRIKKFIASGRGFSKVKKEAIKMIPVYEKAIEVLKANNIN